MLATNDFDAHLAADHILEHIIHLFTHVRELIER